ncbi:MAG: 3-isopropylmalate dehydratase small subunit [Thermodesulfobacteriota bacterium]
MEPINKVKGIVAPLDRANVDTDQIIPKQFLKRIERTGFGEFLFFDWRFNEDGTENPDFVLNHPRYKGAAILLTWDNFGGGSAREHAPWALKDYGFLAIIAPSFADIFYNNCIKNGMLPVTLPKDTVAKLFERAQEREGYELTVDLESQTIKDGEGWAVQFKIDPFKKTCLMEGLDDIYLTLQHEDKIRAYEESMG